ncbi:MAG: class I SAM-dependent methyltransferase [Spirochaetales bacterium]|nr:class I SAM-dependent methyltransferase [Spirochaetales bacterium]
MKIDRIIDRGILPDPLLRAVVRGRCRDMLKEYNRFSAEELQEQFNALIANLDNSPVAIETRKANEQHYELPPDFFEIVLGPHLKYSSCYWDETTADLKSAEERMLALTCQRADLGNGQAILELGCGWGSLSLFMAARFPGSTITAVSYSAPQREFILARARARGIANLRVLTMDMNNLQLDQKFDRIVSVEMFEHLRNYRLFFQKLAGMLTGQGKLFIHIFAHHSRPFLYDDSLEDNWMARYFFTGGTMPSASLFFYLADGFRIAGHWQVQGTHYEKTLNAWLACMDRNKAQLMPVLKSVYGDQAFAWWHRWRLFFLSCAEFFGYAGGNEWLVQHYLFVKK